MSFPPLFIDFHTSPRIRLRLALVKHTLLAQKTALYAMRHFQRAACWSLVYHARDLYTQCSVVPWPFLAWLDRFSNVPAVEAFLQASRPRLDIDGEGHHPPLTIGIPADWLCIAFGPENSALRYPARLRENTPGILVSDGVFLQQQAVRYSRRQKRAALNGMRVSPKGENEDEVRYFLK